MPAVVLSTIMLFGEVKRRNFYAAVIYLEQQMKKLFYFIVFTVILGIIGAIFCMQSLLYQVHKVELPSNDIELGIAQPKTEEVPEKKAEENDEVVNLALYGLDRRNPDEASRSDTIMVVSINKKTRQIKVTSLMRDMYVPIPGMKDNRINAAYAFGGPTLSLKTINSVFGLDVRDYVAIDFSGLIKVIDEVGGVDIEVKENEARLCYVNQPGLQTLNGKQALAYSRIRHTGNGDYERTERQRNILNQIYRKIKEKGVLKLPRVISALLPYVETSLSNWQILQLSMDVAGLNAENLEQFRLPVDSTFTSRTIRNMMVLVPDIEKNKILLHEFIYGKTKQ